MKYIISESQFLRIQEQFISSSGPIMAPLLMNSFQNFRKKYPNFDILASIGLWFVPYVGPYLSVTYSSLVAVEKIMKGDKVSGIIELITSPLVLMKTIKVLKIIGTEDEMLKMLQTINKSGVPLFVSQGQEAFMKWGWKTFGKKFESFIKLLNNETQMKNLLLQLKKK